MEAQKLGQAEPPLEEGFSIFDEGERHARDVPFFHRLGHECVEEGREVV